MNVFTWIGDPNVGLPVNVKWPSLNSNANSDILFSTDKVSVESGYRQSFCDQWDKYGYDF